jgi:hypothetical protein
VGRIPPHPYLGRQIRSLLLGNLVYRIPGDSGIYATTPSVRDWFDDVIYGKSREEIDRIYQEALKKDARQRGTEG